ncbi:MAG: DciA family protein [Methyloprofundus sp.]|nr:DciA family protein [Methyloprofundus sp.]
MSFKNASFFSYTSAIQSHLNRHQRILRIILAASPGQLKPHIKDCVINDNGRLLVYVSSAVWASQLRFLTAQIKAAVNDQSNERIQQIRIRVLNPEPFKATVEEKKIFPSMQSIDLIKSSAEGSSDSKLKDALLSLSNTLKKHS